MSSLQEIESAIEQLPTAAKWELLHHLQTQLKDEWDEQIEKDAVAGRLDFLLAEVKADIAAGRTKPLHEVIDHS